MIAKSIKADIVQSTHVRLATRAAPESSGLLTSRINELMLTSKPQGTTRSPRLAAHGQPPPQAAGLPEVPRCSRYVALIAKLGLRK
jgi:hypothetical protein